MTFLLNTCFLYTCKGANKSTSNDTIAGKLLVIHPTNSIMVNWIFFIYYWLILTYNLLISLTFKKLISCYYVTGNSSSVRS